MKRVLLPLLVVFAATAVNAQEITAPDFTLKDLGGKPIKMSDYKGKVVLLNFWATWCGPCKDEIPDLVKVYDTFKNKGFVVLGVSLDDEPQVDVPPFVSSFKKATGVKITYPLLIGDDTIGDSYGGIRGIPTSFLIDRKGVIRKKYIGPPGRTSEEVVANLKTAVTKLL
jgi:peroxiredoxin